MLTLVLVGLASFVGGAVVSYKYASTVSADLAAIKTEVLAGVATVRADVAEVKAKLP